MGIAASTIWLGLAAPAIAAQVTEDAVPSLLPITATATTPDLRDAAPRAGQDLPQLTGEPEVSEDIAPSAPVTAPESAAAETSAAEQARLKLTVGIRARFDVRFDDARLSGDPYTSTHLSFDTLILTLNYDSPTLFGAAEYRFYGGNFIYSRANGFDGYPGEVSFPSFAYAGVKLTPQDKVTVGFQSVPFDERYWGSSWYNTLGFVYGLEEVYNVGISASHSDGPLDLTAGYFPTTGPAGFGISRDSARYSVNIVRADPYVPDATDNTERDMFVGRIRYRLATSEEGALMLAGSAWASRVRNYDTDRDGSRRAYAVSLRDTRRPLQLRLLAARQAINPRNLGRDDLIAVGDYDSSYNIAARSTMLLGEVSRNVDTGAFPFTVNLYGSYTHMLKDDAGFADTQRINLGAYWNDKASQRIKIWSEFLIGRNDPYVGAGQFVSGAAQGGDDRWKTSFLIMAGYFF